MCVYTHLILLFFFVRTFHITITTDITREQSTTKTADVVIAITIEYESSEPIAMYAYIVDMHIHIYIHVVCTQL